MLDSADVAETGMRVQVLYRGEDLQSLRSKLKRLVSIA